MFKIGKSIQKLTTKLHNTILQETYLNQNKLKWSKAPTTMKLLHPPKTNTKTIRGIHGLVSMCFCYVFIVFRI